MTESSAPPPPSRPAKDHLLLSDLYRISRNTERLVQTTTQLNADYPDAIGLSLVLHHLILVDKLLENAIYYAEHARETD